MDVVEENMKSRRKMQKLRIGGSWFDGGKLLANVYPVRNSPDENKKFNKSVMLCKYAINIFYGFILLQLNIDMKKTSVSVKESHSFFLFFFKRRITFSMARKG